MKHIYIPLCVLLILTGCKERDSVNSSIVTVSIEPLKFLTEQITGNDFTINVLVPKGAGPETYEPLPSQMRDVTRSEFFITVGLIDFEHKLEKSIQENAPEVRIVDLSKGIDLIEGHCSHGEKTHRHGTDPHIWNSPKSLKIMADHIFTAVMEKYPDSLKYEANYTRLKDRLEQLDRTVDTIFMGRPHVFMIYHPALTYLARDYNLQQIALEYEGKEPSADYIRKMIDTARKYDLTKIFYQEQFSRSTVEALSKELNIMPVPMDPLAYDIIRNTVDMAVKITSP